MGKASALYLLCSIVLTWPVLAHPGGVIPMDQGDPILNAAILHWNAVNVPLTERWWNFPSFAPIEGVTALTEHLLGLWPLTSPVVWATGNPLLAYNTAFFVSFTLAGAAMFALARHVTASTTGALLAGLAFAFNPYRSSQLSHIQMLITFGMPLALLGLHWYVSDGRRVGLGLFAAGWLSAALSNGYFLLFFGVYVACWLLWFGSRPPTWRRASVAVAVWAGACVPIVPLLLGYIEVHEHYGLSRQISEIRTFSADITGLFNAPTHAFIATRFLPTTRGEAGLFPGLALLVLAVIGVVRGTPRARAHDGWRQFRWCAGAGLILFGAAAITAAFTDVQVRALGISVSISSVHKPLTGVIGCLALLIASTRRARALFAARHPALFYALMVVLMFLLSLGPEARFRGLEVMYGTPYSWLVGLPGFEGLRVPARFWMLGIMSLCVLAAFAFRERVRRPGRMVVLAGVVIFAEGWAPVPAVPVSFAQSPPVPAGQVLLSLPLGQVFDDGNAQLRAVANGFRTVNGYSGYEPAHYAPLHLGIELGDAGVLTELRSRMPLYIDAPAQGDQNVRSWFVDRFRDAQLVAVSRERALYRLTQQRSPLAADPGPSVSYTVAAASCNAVKAPVMLDRSLGDRWECGPAVPGQHLVLDTGSLHRLAGLGHAIGPHPHDAPRELRVDVSVDGERWQTVWSGLTQAAALRGALEDHGRIELRLAWPATEGRYVRLTQLGEEYGWYWSIAELRLFGR